MNNSDQNQIQAQIKERLSSLKGLHLIGPMPFHPPSPWPFPIVAIDGGLAHIPSSSQPLFWIGDGDSLNRDLKAPFLDILKLKLDCKKDVSDLAVCLSLLPESLTDLHLWGFLGGNKAHEMANLGEVHRFIKARPGSQAIFYRSFESSEKQISIFGNGQWSKTLHGVFSLLALESCQVRLFGEYEYKIDPPLMMKPLASFGVNNIGKGLVHIHTSGPIMIYE